MFVAIHNTPISEDRAQMHAAVCTRCENEMKFLPGADTRRAFAILNNVCLHAAGSNPYIKPFAKKNDEGEE